jgi:hypothetical protein
MQEVIYQNAIFVDCFLRENYYATIINFVVKLLGKLLACRNVGKEIY